MSSCLIIGAGPGIGAATARRFAREGHGVVLLARRPEALEAIRATIEPTGVHCATFPVDVADANALREALDRSMDELGEPGSVVYNAVAWPPGDLMTIPPDALLESLAVNAVGTVVAAQTCVDRMPVGASLLITGGGIVFAPSAAAAGLALGKTANRLVTALLAESLAERGVHVATVVVAGLVEPGGRFDPDAIAGELWRLHRQPRDAWEHETVWR